jgi:threonine aldolase
MNLIDLRSDTITKPSRPMLEAMMAAVVGDDVFGEDPTMNRLQERVASMFGKEAALFVPSGTMGNELAIKTHTQPGDEVIVDAESHIFVYETAGPSLLSGVQLRPLPSTNGVITAEQIGRAIRANIYYLPRTRLICIENTHGRSGGKVFPLTEIVAISRVAKDSGVRFHLDGARIWNASVATGIELRSYADCVDSLSVCFSKGLGTPIGSILIGTREFVETARKYRKIFGGGMRQVGILAAAALYALDHNVERLKEDHVKAKFFAGELSTIRTLAVDPAEVETNMVIIETEKTGKSQEEVLLLLKEHGVLLTPERSSAVRAVMHLDVSMAQVKQAAKVFHSVF